MKNINKQRLMNYALLATAGSILIPTACKKDDEPTDNPNVIFEDIDDVVVEIIGTGVDSSVLDINKDGISDFFLYAYSDFYNDSSFTVSYLYAYDSDVNENKVSGRLEPIISEEEPDSAYFISAVPKNVDIKSFNSLVDYGIFSGETTSENYPNLKGKKDQIVGVKFKIGAEFHYGWIKVDISNDGKKITVKEWAYNTVPNETLKAGEI